MQNIERTLDSTVVLLEKHRKKKAPKLAAPSPDPYPEAKEDVAYYLMMAIKALKNGKH